MLFRSLASSDEFPLFDTFALPASGVGARMKPFAQLAAEGDYRPEWLWLALDGDRPAARAAFWGPADAAHPMSVDFFDFDDVDTGAALLRAAYEALVPAGYHHPLGNERPDYHLFLPADWRERPDALRDARQRMDAAEKAGLHFHVERLNLRWEAEYGLPARTGRLTLEPVTDDEVLLDLLAEIITGSLDAWDQESLTKMSLREAANEALTGIAGMPGGRDRWRLGYNEAGELVGMVMPTKNVHFATHGYIGVAGPHRGRGYAYDLLVESMHRFAEEGEQVITDNTDVGNHPMAATFDRAGFRIAGRRVIFK
ncbi:GNAT family N-acetyltransferase [Nonomuraea sp. NPDC050310]|uniref:GNAT family N-acetyltransferase n=1 Tax=Nonomuraea sp. NPDC050310 TaxID=3154935 RepID=UPI0033E5622C